MIQLDIKLLNQKHCVFFKFTRQGARQSEWNFGGPSECLVFASHFTGQPVI
jgi:hypothetical protein